MPGAEKIFNTIVRDANNALIDVLKQQSQLILQVRTPVPRLSTDHYLSLCSVHRDGKLLRLYDLTQDHGSDVTIGNFDLILPGTGQCI
jgi:hypothetical protein